MVAAPAAQVVVEVAGRLARPRKASGSNRPAAWAGDPDQEDLAAPHDGELASRQSGAADMSPVVVPGNRRAAGL